MWLLKCHYRSVAFNDRWKPHSQTTLEAAVITLSYTGLLAPWHKLLIGLHISHYVIHLFHWIPTSVTVDFSTNNYAQQHCHETTAGQSNLTWSCIAATRRPFKSHICHMMPMCSCACAFMGAVSSQLPKRQSCAETHLMMYRKTIDVRICPVSTGAVWVPSQE